MAGHRTVLIVDDDPKLVQALTLRCLDLGLQVRTASDGLECLILMVKSSPDLLVLDLPKCVNERGIVTLELPRAEIAPGQEERGNERRGEPSEAPRSSFSRRHD